MSTNPVNAIPERLPLPEGSHTGSAQEPVQAPGDADPEASQTSPEIKRRSALRVIVTLGVLAAMSGLFLYVPIDYEKIGAWGYLGVFVIVFIATASFILPIPYLFVVARAAIFLNPWLVALVAAAAAAVGELTGYVVGVSGRELIAKNKYFDKAEYWMRTYGFWCVAFFSFIPNPFFDAIGFAAGVLRYSIWKFLLACFIGKGLKFLLAAWTGDWAHFLGWLD